MLVQRRRRILVLTSPYWRTSRRCRNVWRVSARTRRRRWLRWTNYGPHWRSDWQNITRGAILYFPSPLMWLCVQELATVWPDDIPGLCADPPFDCVSPTSCTLCILYLLTGSQCVGHTLFYSILFYCYVHLFVLYFCVFDNSPLSAFIECTFR